MPRSILFLSFLICFCCNASPAELDTTLVKFMRIEDTQVRERRLLDFCKNNFKNTPEQTLRYLNIILKNVNNDLNYSLKTEALVLKAGVYEMLGKNDLALKYNFAALGYSKAIHDKNVEARALRQIANNFSTKNYTELSYRYNLRSLQICRSQKNLRGYAAALNNLGIDYKSSMDFDKSIYFFQQSLILKNYLNDKKNSVITYCLIGISYSSIGDYKKAYNCYINGLKICYELNDLYGLSVCNGLLSELFFSLKEYELATKYLFRSSVLKSRIKNKLGIIDSNVLFGLLKEKMGNKSEALIQYKTANKEYLYLDNSYGVCNTYSKIANLYLGENQIDSAIFYIKKSILLEEKKKLKYSLIEDYLIYCNLLIKKSDFKLCSKMLKKVAKDIYLNSNPLFESELQKVLSLINLKLGNTKSSLAYYKKFLRISERIVNSDLRNSITLNEEDIEQNHQTRKKLIRLQQENNLNDKILLKQNAEIKLNSFIEILLESSIFALICFVIVQQYYYRRLLKIQELELKDYENFLKSSLNQERSEIAKDIHDFVGSDLNTLLLQSRILERGSISEATFEISKIKEAILDSLIKIDNIIWSLKKPSVSVQESFIQIEEYFRTTTSDYSISLQVESPKNAKNFNISYHMHKDIFLACKETLNNALKHSHATEIRLEFSYLFPKISIKILDNGIGFDSAIEYRGNGIKSRQKRVTRHNGTIEISSQVGIGTCVEMSFFSIE